MKFMAVCQRLQSGCSKSAKDLAQQTAAESTYLVPVRASSEAAVLDMALRMMIYSGYAGYFRVSRKSAKRDGRVGL